MKRNTQFNRFKNNSESIKQEINSYDNQIPLRETQKKWNGQSNNINCPKQNRRNNYNNNKFLGIKREMKNDNNSNSLFKSQKYKPDNFNINNNSNNEYNFNKNKKIKKENDNNHLKNSNNNIKEFDRKNNNKNNHFNNFNSNNNNNEFYEFNNNKRSQNNNKSFESNNQNEKNNLPIYSVKEDILNAIEHNRVTIISGNTGCGKSTQVPQFIYCYNNNNKILMTQPRRIAAVSIAKRLAIEMDEKIGRKIGYHVSMNQKFGIETKIFVKTTGIFMEELIHKNLEYSHIIIDEVHERDIFVDLVLALIKWHFQNNPNSKIKIIIMSATIAEESFANYLQDINGKKVPIVRIHETLYTVFHYKLNDIVKEIINNKLIKFELRKEIRESSTSFFSQLINVPVFMKELFPVVAAIIELIEINNPNNYNGVLIFIPGLAEIEYLQEYLSKYFINTNKLEFLILHSQISDDEQDKVFKNLEKKRKIILATNIAESSITISNIDFVIDFCLVKQTKFNEYQNTSTLELKWCSKASCQQRKGRTGRINKGYYFQLIGENLYKKLEDHPRPEILRSPLETPILKLKIYEPDREPQDILFKTINPPTEETIIKILF